MPRTTHDRDIATQFLEAAVQIAQQSVLQGGGPFGAVIAKDGTIVASGGNAVVLQTDPTAHAEIVAIRGACAQLGTHVLSGCVLYSSCEPCPMCLGAIYWARLDAVWFSATRHDAARVGFSDAMIYREIGVAPSDRAIKMWHCKVSGSDDVFKRWQEQSNKTMY